MEKKLRVLIVEDLTTDVELAERELRTVLKNYTVQVVDTEEGFEQALETFKPDLIISDYQMPVFDGLSALKIRQEKSPFTPFVILTGSMNEDTAVECIKEGADDYVIKEHIKRLGPAVLKAMERKKIERERKQAEEELRKLSTAVQQSPSVIAITDLKGNLEYVNPKFTELTGYTSEEAIDQKSSILKSAKLSDELYKELWDTISSGKVWHGEFHNKKKNGEFFWEAASISPIFDKQGKITNYIKVAEDITERKRAEQIQKVLYNISNAVITSDNLKKLISLIQKELGIIIDTTNFYIALYDSKTNTLSLPFFTDEKDELPSYPVGKTLTYYVIKTQEPLLATKEKIKKLKKSGDVESFGTDSEIWLGVPLKIEGEVTGVLAVQSYTDVFAYDDSDMEMLEFVSDQISISIDRKKAEEDLIAALKKAEESDRLKTAFLHNMSHEIRTPMNGILGFTNLLLEPGLTGEEQHEYIDIIKINSDRMLNTINDLVDISMIESGHVKISVSEVNVNEQTKDLYTFFKPEANKKELQIICKNSLPEQEAIIKTDKEKLYSVLTNIIKNSIKYSNDGTIEFGYEKKRKYLEFFVKDTGIGIPKDRQQAIFDRFIQADIENTRAYEGSGLGLSISKAYVEMLGGKIWMKSEEGVGSQFYFTIPYNTDKKEITASKDAISGTKSENKFKNLKILIAEDEEEAVMYLKLVVKKFSSEILYAETGTETVDICRKIPDIDLILMDIRMPEMNGYEATRKIREFNKDVVIIAQTAYALSGNREKAIEAGCNDYISKPIDKDELREMIGKYLNKEEA